MPTKSTRRRLAALGTVFVIMAGLMVYRMVELQVRQPESYVAFGESQRVHEVELPGRRGDLLDRNGEKLAFSIPQRTVWADPRLVVDPQATAAALAPVLDLDESFLVERLTTDAAFVYLARQIDDESAEAVAALDLDGVAFLDEPRRFNPSAPLAAGVVGVVGVDHVGLSGLEKQYDELLAGVPGLTRLETAPDGRTIATAAQSETPAERGADLTLSIDRPLQYEVERMLRATVVDMAAQGGVVVAMKPSTGEILAMASVARDDEGAVVVTDDNRAVTWAFEPGSITKPLTFAAVLEEGIATPDSIREVPSTYQLYDSEFSDSSPHPTERWSVTDILVKSSNIGTMLWAMDLGPTLVDQYLRSFGFGTTTDLDFVGESSGVMLDVDQWSGTSIATIPIGQGISVTPVQMLSALNVIANGGLYVPPRLVLDATDGEGEPVEIDAGATRRVVSERTARQLRAMMAGVVERGTGQQAEVAGYTVAGKTGTAWIPQPGGGYVDGAGNYHYMASFAGFLPAESPEVSILVTLEEPSNQIYGGYAAAPLFADIAEYAMRHFQIPPAGEVVVDAAPSADDAVLLDDDGGERVRALVAPTPTPEPPADTVDGIGDPTAGDVDANADASPTGDGNATEAVGDG